MNKLLAITSLMLICSSVQAHLLKVFAVSRPVDSNMLEIKGKVYFSGGQNVSGSAVAIFDQFGKQIESTKTNEQGKFQITLINNQYKLVADTQDGHKASWQLKSSVKHLIENNTVEQEDKKKSADIKQNIAQLENIIAAQVSEQIIPLTEQIIHLQEKRRFQDVIGAIGYIVGLSSLFLWFRQRQLNKTDHT